MKCAFTKSDGQTCNANALRAERFCFTHNPKTREALLTATRKGGKSPRMNRNPQPPAELKNIQDVAVLLASTINEAREGLLELRVANCVGYLSGHLLRALEASEMARLEERIAVIEKRVL